MDAVIPHDLAREETLWFPDGTLILWAQNHLFRVFPGILAAKSPVFQDMLSFPQPQNGESYDGCLLVYLSDSAADATHFLKAIFHYDYFEQWPARVSFDIVAGILRLSQKYQVEPLKKRALVHLSRRYPITLEEFVPTDEWHDPIAVANLARHVLAEWILPVVLYFCTWLKPEDFLDGSLSPSDRLLCLRARDQLQTRWASKVLNFLWEPPQIPGCETRESCADLRVDCRALAETWREEHIPFSISGVKVFGMKLPSLVNQQSRQAFWDNLPTLFGLPDWLTLRNMRTAALGSLDAP
ncbi:hypothetical protein C8R45DRAFT_1223452 [Mycena sanguinolenta]|nr:hypothetical protein C8R45DRAFT_1223452 [Mycena sanguinolenta]